MKGWRARGSVVIAVTVVMALVGGACSKSHAGSGSTRPPARFSPSTVVNPFMGTGVGGAAVGNINASPAADLPFGMMQWGPDTSPHRAKGGGYSFGDTAMSGLSLTHLNGPGCPGLGDVPILPTLGAISGRPEEATAAFTHAAERAAPGRYDVQLANGIGVDLAVTTRTGLASITFPATLRSNVLFKVADSAVAATKAHAQIVGDHEVTGWVESGHFCDTLGTYRLSFDAEFDHPFARVGTWNGATLHDGSRSVDGAHSGLAVTFDTRTRRTVMMKVGISFVSVDAARENLDAENKGWSLAAVEQAATARWDSMLQRIAVSGGRAADRATFYSALYRSLLHPNVFSDVDGRYPGFDHLVHTAAPGTVQYANFSGWDVYRSEIPLLALLAPETVGEMMQSLLADADQTGRLPKLPITDADTGEMNGDSIVPILAEAYAFGVRNFDARAALRYMVKGATAAGTGLGWDVERQDMDEYLRQGWIEVDRRDRTSFDYTIGGSETLEYAIDDSAIAQLASALGDRATAATFAARAGNWHHLFNSATGYLAARSANGAFPSGPAFQVSPVAGIGQDGWEEGNSIQYTWSVPQDLRGLFDAMGGNGAAVAKLDRFFGHLNTSRKEPYDWAGNEPALGIPWEYDFAGAPWRTQDVVRRIATSLYSATPNGEPGNDDLGALSSWYVWAAIGLYPETSGRADLVLSTPMFSRVTIRLRAGKTIVISAAHSSMANRYIRALDARGVHAPAACASSGAGYQCPWLPASVLTTGARLRYTLAATPDRSWGAAPAAAPPSITGGS